MAEVRARLFSLVGCFSHNNHFDASNYNKVVHHTGSSSKFSAYLICMCDRRQVPANSDNCNSDQDETRTQAFIAIQSASMNVFIPRRDRDYIPLADHAL
jgi:hypothetical protein